MDSTIAMAQHALVHAMPSRNPQRRIKADVILGSPGSGCQGVGICRVMAYKEQTTCKCKKITAWITAKESGNISISFWKSEMDPRFVRRHFGWMLFQVFEAYELPERFSNVLDCMTVVIKPGIYSVWESPQFLTVDF